MLIVIHIGHTPKRKNSNNTLLYNGKLIGIIGHDIPSPSNSFTPQYLYSTILKIKRVQHNIEVIDAMI